MKSVQIDLPRRIEKRFIIKDLDELLKRIAPVLKPKKFSDNEYIQTIYFNNNEHVVPFNQSLKARIYLPNITNPPTLYDKYLLDLKKQENGAKQKTRLEVTLDEAVEIVNPQLPKPDQLRPYSIVQYLRQHFTNESVENFRLTIDTNLEYFYIKPNKDIVYTGNEDYTRAEIKSKSQTEFVRDIEKIIEKVGAFPIISKKFTSYNYLKQQHEVKDGAKKIYKELKDTEIESKLEIIREKNPEGIFQEIKDFFRDPSLTLTLSPNYTHTHETASINRYYKDSEGEFKTLAKGKLARVVLKADGQFLDDPYGLDCILKRHEVKGDRISVWSDKIQNAELLGELRRKRRAFWLDNLSTGRIYHITVDHCHNTKEKNLYQLEVEYTGAYNKPSQTIESEIVKDIADITHIIVDNFPDVIPSKITKQNWVVS